VLLELGHIERLLYAEKEGLREDVDYPEEGAHFEVDQQVARSRGGADVCQLAKERKGYLVRRSGRSSQ